MPDFIEYITKDGDRWDLIAWAKYGDVEKMNILIEDNPQVPTDPILPSGLRMIVRVLEPADEIVDSSLLPPWKR